MSINPMSVETNRLPSLGAESQTRFALNPQGGNERPQSLDAALDTLVKSMTNDKGEVNSDNPLVKMLADYLEKALSSMLQQAGVGGNTQGSGAAAVKDMSPEELKNALSGMLEQLLGSNAGAGNGFGGGAGGAGGAGGGEDMLSKLLGALAQDKLGSLLQPSDDGGAKFSEEDKALLEEVAKFMDQHPETFGSPENADGKTRSWSDELSETTPDGKPDLTLSGGEASAFQKAIDMIGQSAGSGSAPASGMLANSGMPISSGEGSGGGGGMGGAGGAFGGANVNVTISAEDFLKLMNNQGANSMQGGSTAQSQALNQDASQAAGSVMDKMFG